MNRSPPPRFVCRYAAMTACACAGLCATAPVALADPTRPPAAWHSAQATASAPAPATPIPRASILLVGRERQIAVVDGQTVRRGDRVGEARVVRIDAYRLVLSHSTSIDSLPTTPLPPHEKRP